MTGLSANKIKWIRSLQQKKFRDELGLFVVEGEKLVNEALQLVPNQIESIIQTANASLSSSTSAETIYCKTNDLSRVSSLKHPQNVLAILRKPKQRTLDLEERLTLVLDGIQDPGNLGTILRIADWFGISQLICSKDTVDCYNPKVIQASMGAILRVPVSYHDLNNWLKNVSPPVYGALLEGTNIYEAALPKEALIVVGNEGKGISESIRERITHSVTIPSFGGSESLNVAVATGIIVSEFRRR